MQCIVLTASLDAPGPCASHGVMNVNARTSVIYKALASYLDAAQGSVEIFQSQVVAVISIYILLTEWVCVIWRAFTRHACPIWKCPSLKVPP